MYVPPRYRVTDDDTIDAFVRANAFATLVSHGRDGLMGSHVPVELATGPDGRRITGHLSKANAQWKQLEESGEAMIVVLGPHTYISPTWYDHPNVPTWNYQSVHLYGPVRTVHDLHELAADLRVLSRHYEPETQPPPRFDLDEMPAALREAEMKGIVGFEMRVTRVDAAFKLSQNRNATDYARIVRELEARGDDASAAIADAMRRESVR